MSTIESQVGEYLAYCEKVRGMTDATMRTKRNVLERFLRATGIEDVSGLTNQVFNRWAESEMRRGISPGSLNAYNAVVIAMVRYCREMGMNVPINLGLVRKVKGEASTRRFYTAEEIERVVRNADQQTGLMIRVMFETGMRIAELARLKWPDFDGRKVRFVGKGRRMREAYVTEETYRELMDYVAENGGGEYVWRAVGEEVHDNGNYPLTTQTVRKYLRIAFLAAGHAGFYPHALRHSFATDLQRRGASVAEIKEMMGHASIATTERYLHGFDGKMRELFDKYR